ncbi:MAG TPA: DCC1-like thiol-disulfide oxidoreductase family protein [Luteitalea sp.]|nr:DCC1-like thiol-disulfide oxidoreductase family protein [Luteitalea sp.]
MSTAPPVVVFDGDCLFCQRSVRFIHRHERQGRLRFAARESTAGRRVLTAAGLDAPPNSMVLVDDEGVWLRSDGVLRIAARLDAPWSVARVFLAIPRPIRDGLYNIVAAIRYRLSARLGPCPLPDASLRARFLE